MEKLILLAMATLLGLGLCGGALAATLSGTVWFSESEGEEAPCTAVTVYTDSDCLIWKGDYTTAVCGYYEIGGLDSDTDYWVTVWFGAMGCAGAGWSGTCPETTIRCYEIHTDPMLPVTNIDWDLELDECDNTECD